MEAANIKGNAGITSVATAIISVAIVIRVAIAVINGMGAGSIAISVMTAIELALFIVFPTMTAMTDVMMETGHLGMTIGRLIRTLIQRQKKMFAQALSVKFGYIDIFGVGWELQASCWPV